MCVCPCVCAIQKAACPDSSVAPHSPPEDVRRWNAGNSGDVTKLPRLPRISTRGRFSPHSQPLLVVSVPVGDDGWRSVVERLNADPMSPLRTLNSIQ